MKNKRLTTLFSLAVGLSALAFRTQASTVIDFEDIVAGAPGGVGGPPANVATRYSGLGVTFNNASGFDYTHAEFPPVPPNFAHSGTKAIEPCYAAEFCGSPFEMNFSGAQQRVKVWVGYSDAYPGSPFQGGTVVLRAFNGSGAQVGQSMINLPFSTGPISINSPLEVSAAGIRRATVGLLGSETPGGPVNNGLAVDDVEFDSETTNRTSRCATPEVLQRLLETVPGYREGRNRLEAFTARYVEDTARKGAAGLRSGILKIPVVVHVVYHTAAENISDAQIHSQIAILNADYRALNSDIGSVPVPFQPLIGDVRIEFALAVRDPNCLPTTGITRTSTSVASFGHDDRVKSSASGGHDAWPGDKYLNLWICNLGDGLLGYAQPPGGGPAATDGVVILHTAFGNTGTASTPGNQYNLGRTATHEIGHWLNLEHIFGSCSCTDDSVSDTPIQSCYNFDCPLFPHVSCGNGPNGDMFMNYMDYVDDRCMMMFSQGQVARMQACLQAPAPAGRAEILGSDGLIPASGLPVAADLWSQDTPGDPGLEPNTVSAPYYYVSDDIWVRVSNDGVSHQDHETPIYHSISGAPNYVYVRVRNRSCSTSGSGTVKLYWAKASSALGWPSPWDGTAGSPCPTPGPMGGLIGSQPTGTVLPGGYVILEFPWNPPNPATYACFGGDKSHFCLLSRIETSPTSPYGMTTPEGPDLNANVRNNNNIVWKNVHVATAADRIGGTTIGNLRTNRTSNRLVFDVPAREQSVFAWGKVLVHLDEPLFHKWQEAGSIGFGIQSSNGVIRLLNPGAVISGLQLEPGELHTVGVEFERSPETRAGNYILPLTLTQQEFRRDAYFAVGGNTFVYKDTVVPGVVTPHLDGSSLTLTWTPFGAGHYQVQCATSLPPTWTTLGATTNTSWILQKDPAAIQRFYRICASPAQ